MQPRWGLWAGVLAGLLAGPSLAATDDTVLRRVQQLEDKVQYMDDLEQELNLLKRRIEVEEEAKAAKGPQPVIGAGPDGFFLQSADRKWVLKLRGYYQADTRWYPGTASAARSTRSCSGACARSSRARSPSGSTSA